MCICSLYLGELCIPCFVPKLLESNLDRCILYSVIKKKNMKNKNKPKSMCMYIHIQMNTHIGINVIIQPLIKESLYSWLHKNEVGFRL